MHKCPNCGSENIHRSRSRTLVERFWKRVGTERLFRCHKCGWRGWGVLTESPGHASDLTADVESPDFDSIDEALDVRNTMSRGRGQPRP
ncbi:MAG: hypothetical protein HYX76_03990 [Acidobacteria bacterium]|nr:hypothetical protein [Acidobacteriota bacterium]